MNLNECGLVIRSAENFYPPNIFRTFDPEYMGFAEVGETFKAAVRREVMEEVGLHVKNITYYKSQPWSFSDSAMIGFFAQLDSEDKITLEEAELSKARWFDREELPDMSSQISTGQELIMWLLPPVIFSVLDLITFIRLPKRKHCMPDIAFVFCTLVTYC